MKKFIASLLIAVLMIGSVNTVNAQETTTIEGSQIAAQLVAEQLYHVIVQDSNGTILFEKNDTIFSNEDITKLNHMFTNGSDVYFDLGTGQLQIPVAQATLAGNVLTLNTTNQLGYDVVFHEGTVTASGLIVEDASDAVVQSTTVETSDLSQWVIADSAISPTGPVELTLDGKEYWATLPYKLDTNGLPYEDSAVMIGAYTLGGSPLSYHFNLAPRVEAPEEVTESEIAETESEAMETTTDQSDESVTTGEPATTESMPATEVVTDTTTQVNVVTQTAVQQNVTAAPVTTTTSRQGLPTLSSALLLTGLL